MKGGDMKRDTLTKTERRFVKAWEAAEGCAVKAAPEWIRGMVRRTAFHEAGHVAARMFNGFEAGHIVHVSIIPDATNNGHTRVRACAELILKHYPPPMKRSAGRCLLLDLLAGRGAANRVADPEDREDILDEDALWMEGEQEGTDLFRALRVAEIMARPGMPARRVLALAEKWTVEMLALPDVWRTVETLAGMLLDRGTIEAAEIMPACENILGMSMNLPKWRRRLHDLGDNTGHARRKARHDE